MARGFCLVRSRWFAWREEAGKRRILLLAFCCVYALMLVWLLRGTEVVLSADLHAEEVSFKAVDPAKAVVLRRWAGGVTRGERPAQPVPRGILRARQGCGGHLWAAGGWTYRGDGDAGGGAGRP